MNSLEYHLYRGALRLLKSLLGLCAYHICLPDILVSSAAEITVQRHRDHVAVQLWPSTTFGENVTTRFARDPCVHRDSLGSSASVLAVGATARCRTLCSVVGSVCRLSTCAEASAERQLIQVNVKSLHYWRGGYWWIPMIARARMEDNVGSGAPMSQRALACCFWPPAARRSWYCLRNPGSKRNDRRKSTQCKVQEIASVRARDWRRVSSH
ncbi:hypothetical protein K474DRAFT_211309 [Panus rudis PR-1116 ss-1]|nr:hypothetical protein K474DRAFT_211309 [Panus rudis PR-1116 ss-1]